MLQAHVENHEFVVFVLLLKHTAHLKRNNRIIYANTLLRFKKHAHTHTVHTEIVVDFAFQCVSNIELKLFFFSFF